MLWITSGCIGYIIPPTSLFHLPKNFGECSGGVRWFCHDILIICFCQTEPWRAVQFIDWSFTVINDFLWEMLSYCVERLSKPVQSTIAVHSVLLLDLRHLFLACFQKPMWIFSQIRALFLNTVHSWKVYSMTKYSHWKSMTTEQIKLVYCTFLWHFCPVKCLHWHGWF